MAQFKRAIFIGRAAADTGIKEYRRLAKRLGLELDEYTHTPNASRFLPKYDIAFVPGYLAILEALSVGVPVLAYYNSAIKKDYLQMAPFVKFILMFTDSDKVNLSFSSKQIKEGRKWARNQTWEKLVRIYEKLWQK